MNWYKTSIFKEDKAYGLLIFIMLFFFFAFTTLLFIKHDHYLTGYDIAVVDQAIWKYSQFKPPISTNHAYAFTSILDDHVELVWLLIAPFYWIFSDIKTLIVLQNLVIISSAIPLYLLMKKSKLNTFLSLALITSFFLFYGTQNAIWADVHSLVFGIGFLTWYIYFLEKDYKKIYLRIIFLLLTIICKEDLALLTGVVSGVYFIFTRKRTLLIDILISVAYTGIIFGIYFPHFVKGGYRFQNPHGLLSDIDIRNFYNTDEKRQVIFYGIASYGFLPLFQPLFLLPAIADLGKYFVLGNASVTSAQGLFMHYRVSLALLLILPTIKTLARFKFLNKWYIGVYVLLCSLSMQYYLHLPLSYLVKSWFWTKPQSATTLNEITRNISSNSSVVSQVNVLPHISHRDNTFILWPDTKNFETNSPCEKPSCPWFRWVGNPTYLIVDTSTDWDERYWLTTRENFINGLENLEKVNIIKKQKQSGTTTLYIVEKNPSEN